jgi:hypothetical protein
MTGYCTTRGQPAQETLDPLGDDRFGVYHRCLARLEARLDHLRQIIDRIEKDIVHFAHLKLDITRHREVDHEHRDGDGAA